MSDNSQDRLGDLADAVAEAFEIHRDPAELKMISLVIDDSTHDRRTLIIHVDGDDVSELADEVEYFLRDTGCHHGTRDSLITRRSATGDGRRFVVPI